MSEAHTGERHWAVVDGRRVHYRRWGEGPAVLVIHGSPQSSRAVAAVAQALAGAGLCAIVPDTLGAGRSDPLPMDTPASADFARALCRFADVLGLRRVGLYGFHTGAATACAFGGLFPERTAALALDGLPAWSDAERADFTRHYLPPLRPAWDGSHMAWTWARIEEQTVFFPWYAQGPDTRMRYAVPDKARAHETAMELLASGDNYRAVYQSAFDFRAGEWVPQLRSPALIATTEFDVLAPHLERPALLGRGRTFPTAPALHAGAAGHLAAHPGDRAPPPPEAPGLGFLRLGSEPIAWRATPGEGPLTVCMHAAGGASDPDPPPGVLALDLPGHGDSAEGWREAPAQLADWVEVMDAALRRLGVDGYVAEGEGLGGRIAEALARRGAAGAARVTGPGHGAPEPSEAPGAISLQPEWDGAHLVRAWRIARWERLFRPWWRRTPEHARTPFDDLDPASVHRRALSLLTAHDRWLAAARLEIV